METPLGTAETPGGGILRHCIPHPKSKFAVVAQLGLTVTPLSGVNGLCMSMTGVLAMALGRSGVNGLGVEEFDLGSCTLSGVSGLGVEAFDLNSCACLRGALSGVSGLGVEAFDIGSCACLRGALSGVSGLGVEEFDLGSCVCLRRFGAITEPSLLPKCAEPAAVK